MHTDQTGWQPEASFLLVTFPTCGQDEARHILADAQLAQMKALGTPSLNPASPIQQQVGICQLI